MQGCESCCLKLNLSMAISQKKKKKQNLVTCTMLIQNSNHLSPITFFWDFSPMSSQKKENITPTARTSEA